MRQLFIIPAVPQMVFSAALAAGLCSYVIAGITVSGPFELLTSWG